MAKRNAKEQTPIYKTCT